MKKPADEAIYLEECIAIEPVAIQEEYVRFPADLAYWNGRAADTLLTHLRTKSELERVEAQLNIELRETVAAEGKKVTVDMLEAMVRVHPTYQAAKLTAIEAEVAKARHAGFVDSLHSKREMLISMGAHIRKEMEGDPVLREQIRGTRLARE